MTRDRYDAALTIDAFIGAATKNQAFWQSARRLARVDDDVAKRANAVGGRWHLLALAEDWCGDAINVLPSVARLAESVPTIELRLVRRDTNPDLMDAHLTQGTRSIPVVIVYDDSMREVGWWGPRPSELQAWFYDEGKALEKDARYKHLRTWYARDRGKTAILELIQIIEGAVPPVSDRESR